MYFCHMYGNNKIAKSSLRQKLPFSLTKKHGVIFYVRTSLPDRIYRVETTTLRFIP